MQIHKMGISSLSLTGACPQLVFGILMYIMPNFRDNHINPMMNLIGVDHRLFGGKRLIESTEQWTGLRGK